MPVYKNILGLSIRFLSICLIAFSPNVIKAQTNSSNSGEDLLDNDDTRSQFMRNIDTIDVYIYRDNQAMKEMIRQCDSILENHRNSLASNDILKYISQKVFHHTYNRELLTSFQVLEEYTPLLEDESIKDKAKNNFIYMKAHTYMQLGDLTFAQSTFYDLIDEAKANKDTASIIRGLYSIGQILGKEEDFTGATKQFEEILNLVKYYNKLTPSAYTLTLLELAEAYINLKDFDNGLIVLDKGIKYLEANNMHLLKADFLFLKIKVALEKDEINKANIIHRQASDFITKSQDSVNIIKKLVYKARILTKEGKGKAALKIYESVFQLNEEVSSSMADIYKEAHEVCYNLKAYDKAYQYLSKSNEMLNEVRAEEEKKKITYFRIKYDTEQQKRENQALSFKIQQQQNRTKYLNILLVFAVLAILLLFWAFYQKRAYNKRLKADVKARTRDIEGANIQLKEQTAFTQKVLKASPSIIHIFDLEKQDVIFANEGTDMILGNDHAFFYNMDSPFLKLMLQSTSNNDLRNRLNANQISIEKKIHPNDIDNVCNPYWEMLRQNEEKVYINEFRIKHTEGYWVWLQEKWIPFSRDKNNKINKILVVSNDVSYIKNAEYATHNALLEGQEKERQRIAADLHDAINPLLSVSKLNVESLKDAINPSQVEPLVAMNNAIELLEESMNSIREISANLHPSLVKDFGLLNALNDLCTKISKIGTTEINFDHFGFKNRLNTNTELSLYRIAQELLNNIIKHADATKAELQLILRDKNLIMMVDDNGKGFESMKNSSGFGFKNIESRVKSLDGSIEIDSMIGRGTTVTVKISLG